MKVHQLKFEDKPCGLHACLRHAMRLSRWTGYFPVQGLDQLYAHGTRFRLKSFYSLFYIFTIIGQVVMCCFCLYWFFKNDITLGSISNVVFYVTGLISAILFLRLAYKWPTLMKKAEETEQSLTKLKLDNSAIRKSSIIAYVIMVLALVEHILCNYFNVKFVMQCLHESKISNKVMENYVMYRIPYVFNYVTYNIFYAVMTEIVIIQATFIWSFNDVLTICFSVYITSYFNSLNNVITSKKKGNSITWGQLREHYSKIALLVNEIDAELSSFILLSFFTDLFFICLQLFNSLHRNYASFNKCGYSDTKTVLSSPDYLLYYLYSFIFLVLRALSLSLFAANVHTAAQRPVILLYDVPSSDYDQEVIGTIITYELVLLQFSITPEQVILPGVIQDNITTTNTTEAN